MKKWVVSLMAGVLLAGSALTASALHENRGGLMGFIAGCCFGIRYERLTAWASRFGLPSRKT